MLTSASILELQHGPVALPPLRILPTSAIVEGPNRSQHFKRDLERKSLTHTLMSQLELQHDPVALPVHNLPTSAIVEAPNFSQHFERDLERESLTHALMSQIPFGICLKSG